MRTTKYVLFGALGVAAVLLLTSGKARKMRQELDEKALDNANMLKDKLWSLGNNASKSVSELRDLLESEIEGLSDSARERIESILNKTTTSANGLKKKVAQKVS